MGSDVNKELSPSNGSKTIAFISVLMLWGGSSDLAQASIPTGQQLFLSAHSWQPLLAAICFGGAIGFLILQIFLSSRVHFSSYWSLPIYSGFLIVSLFISGPLSGLLLSSNAPIAFTIFLFCATGLAYLSLINQLTKPETVRRFARKLFYFLYFLYCAAIISVFMAQPNQAVVAMGFCLLMTYLISGVMLYDRFRKVGRPFGLMLIALGLHCFHALTALLHTFQVLDPSFYGANASSFLVFWDGLLLTASIVEAHNQQIEGNHKNLVRQKAYLEEEVETRSWELRHQQSRLIETAKIAGVADIAAGMAKQINSPLAIILGYCKRIELLDQRQRLTIDEAKNLIAQISTAALRIDSTIKGLRMMAHEDDHAPFYYERVAHLMKESVGLCDFRFEEAGVRLEQCEIDQTLRIECRAGQVIQVLFNILCNALEAVKEVPSPWVKIEVAQNEEMVEIIISDCGVIQSDEVKAKMFEPFYSTKPSGTGIGLGLTTSDHIVRSHNGSLYLDTGSTNTKIILQFPKHQVAAKRA